MNRLARLETTLLLAIASSLTAVWLGLWVQWSLDAWSTGANLPAGWPVGLALVGMASSGLTSLALRQHPVARRSARVWLAVAGAAAICLLAWWALGARVNSDVWREGPRLGGLAAPGGMAFLAALVAWWQGERLGRGPLGNQALRSAFNTGIFGLAPLLALNSLQAVLPSGQVLGALMLFFGLGLSALALSSLRQTRQQPSSGGPVALALGRQWLLTSSVVIGLVLGAGLLAARLTAPEALQRLGASLVDSLAYGLGLLLGPLAALAERLLAPVLPGLVRFLERFLSNLELVMGRLQELLALLAQLLSLGRPGGGIARRLQAFFASGAFQAGTRWAGLLAVLAVAGVIFWLAARKMWALQSIDEDEQRESVLSRRLLLAQLRQLLRRRPRRPAASAAYLALSGAPDDARLIIRRAYQAMLEWARSLRLPRAAGQTPRAYALMLAGVVPEGHDAIDLLTQAYVLARYAAEAPSLEQAHTAEGAMARLKALHS